MKNKYDFLKYEHCADLSWCSQNNYVILLLTSFKAVLMHFLRAKAAVSFFAAKACNAIASFPNLNIEVAEN